MATILVFGDSIAWGAWDEKGGWVQRLRTYLESKYPDTPSYMVYNLGVSGNTSDDIVRRFESEAKERLNEEKDAIILIQIGGNDSAFMHQDKDNWVSFGRFGENIRKIIGLARKYTDKIVFVEDTPMDDSALDPVPWDTRISYKNGYIRKYEDLIKKACEDERIHFIETWPLFEGMEPKSFLEDGCHPNSRGHELIFERVIDYLEGKGIIGV